MADRYFLTRVAWRAMDLLNERKALLYPDGTAFWVWPRDDRAILIFDPVQIDLRRVNDVFAHELSTRLGGRRVVHTNSRGVFLQVGYDIPPALIDLAESPLDLGAQPTPLHIPIGMTGRGALWLDLVEADSILIGGSRGMGKTGMMHGWIQVLLHGGQVEVWAWDGKQGSEFGRYADRPQFQLLSKLETSLYLLIQTSNRRRVILTKSGYPNAQVYNANANAQGGEQMQPIALIVDEAALVRESIRPLLKELVERARDTGVHPIFGTNNPQQSQLVVKSNLVTRISLAVPTLSASVMVLGSSGAEKLPRQRGRGLIERNARMVEFQAFGVTYPIPSEQALQKMADCFQQAHTPLESAPMEREHERILALHEQGKSMSAIVREVYNVSGGDTFLRRMGEVKAILADTTTTTTSPKPLPILGLTGA